MGRWLTASFVRRAMAGLLLATASWAAAQDSEAPEEPGLRPEQHAWARFAPGAWKRVRVITETLGPDGRVESTAVQETTTRLDKVENGLVTLHSEGTSEVSGSTLPTPAQTTVQGLSGQPAEGDFKLRALPDGAVTIEDTPYDCRVEQMEITTPTHRTVTTNYYSSQPPYLLRSESNSNTLDGEGLTTNTVMEVSAFEMPYRIGSTMRPTSVLRMLHKHAKGATLTIARSSLDVPGGIVAYSSRERNASGQVVRRSTLELLDFGGDLAPPGATAAAAP